MRKRHVDKSKLNGRWTMAWRFDVMSSSEYAGLRVAMYPKIAQPNVVFAQYMYIYNFGVLDACTCFELSEKHGCVFRSSQN
jgi:hypothetical protein